MRAIGPYQFVHILGEGRMGIVSLAQHCTTGQLVAIKQLPLSGISTVRRQWFAREIALLARFNHSAIPHLCNSGQLADTTPWFAMKLIAGQRPATYCEQSNLSTKGRLALFCNICEAVRYVHGQHTIHRDIKSSNILIDASGEPHLLDFGIARATLGRDDPGISADIYALGTVLCEMLTGNLPSTQRGNPSERTPLSRFDRPLSRATWQDLDVLCRQAIRS